MFVLAGNSLDHFCNNMAESMDETSTAVKRVNIGKNLNITTDIRMGKAIADYLDKDEMDRKGRKKPSSVPKIAHVLHIRDFKKDAAIRKKLREKLRRLAKENSSNVVEFKQLHHDMVNYFRRIKGSKKRHKVIELNHRLGVLKTVWAGSELSEKKSLHSAASSENVFDMSSLDLCLPSQPGDNIYKKKTKRLAEEYFSFKEKLRQSFRRSEILRVLASCVPEQSNNNPPSTSKHYHSHSITRMVKKVYGDVKNVRIFSFRPLAEKGSKAVGSQKSRLYAVRENRQDAQQGFENLKIRLLNVSLQSEEDVYRFSREKIVLLKFSCTRKDETRSDQPKGENASSLNSNPANNLRNPERLLFNRDQSDERHRSASLRTKELLDSLSLSRQMSRLKITNSRRDGLSADIGESELLETSTVRNVCRQDITSAAKRRKQIVERLREEYQNRKEISSSSGQMSIADGCVGTTEGTKFTINTSSPGV